MVAVPVHKQGGLGFRRYFERMLLALIEKGLGISLFVSGLSRGHTDKEVQGVFFFVEVSNHISHSIPSG